MSNKNIVLPKTQKPSTSSRKLLKRRLSFGEEDSDDNSLTIRYTSKRKGSNELRTVLYKCNCQDDQTNHSNPIYWRCQNDLKDEDNNKNASKNLTNPRDQNRRNDPVDNKDETLLFLRKTHEMISTCDPKLAKWTPSGDTFMITNPIQFSTEVIPKYFDHGHLPYFRWQLNCCGFQEFEDTNTGGFYHENFKRDKRELLYAIKDSTKGGAIHVYNQRVTDYLNGDLTGDSTDGDRSPSSGYAQYPTYSLNGDIPFHTEYNATIKTKIQEQQQALDSLRKEVALCEELTNQFFVRVNNLEKKIFNS